MSNNQDYNPISLPQGLQGLQETRMIVQDLLADLSKQTSSKIIQKIRNLVLDLNAYNQDLLIQNDSENSFASIYYSLHFEAIDFETRTGTERSTIYIGYGVDLDMQKNVLGFWLKDETENPYKFWLRVCLELKQLGIEDIENKFDNLFWLTEAMNQVFGCTSR